MKISTKRLFACVMLVSFVFNTFISAEGIKDKAIIYAKEREKVELGNKKIVVKEDCVIIDNQKIAKIEFLHNLSKIQKFSASPLSVMMVESAEQDMNSAKNSNGLVGIGIGIKGIFERINFELFLVLIGTITPLVIPAGTFQGVNRDIKVIITSAGIMVDGIAMGLNWLTYSIAEYVSKNSKTIQEYEDIEEEISETARKYPLLKCVEAANAIRGKLINKRKHGELIILEFKYSNTGGVWSDIKNTTISDNNYHYGILYNGKIYCNVHPNGLLENDWINDFHGLLPRIIHRIPF